MAGGLIRLVAYLLLVFSDTMYELSIGYFEATWGYICDLFTAEARSAEVNKHICPRCL
jgi:hypothetical protein